MNKINKIMFVFFLFILLSFSSSAVLDVFVSDQTTRPFDLFFIKSNGSPTNLTNNVSVDQTWIMVDSVASISIGDYLGIFSNRTDKAIFYFGEVLNIAGTNITLDTPLDYSFVAGSNVISSTRDLNVDGSNQCQTFIINGPGSNENFSIDITRIIFKIITENSPDFSKFGDIAGGLTKGLVLRKKNNYTENIFNVKTNGEFVNLMYDIQFFDPSNPGTGVYGLGGRYTFGGKDKHGVVIRLYKGESLDLIICDDLSSLVSFRVVAAGHIVDNTNYSSVVTIPSKEEEQSMYSTAIILGLIGLIVFLIYVSKDLFNKPSQTNRKISYILNVKNLAVFIYLLSSWIVVGITGYLAIISSGTLYASLMTWIFICTTLLVVAFNIIYTTVYIIYTISDNLQEASKIKKFNFRK